MAWFLSFFTGGKIWIYSCIAIILASLIGIFIWRGYEVTDLTKRLQVAENSALAARSEAVALSSLRDQELKSQKEAQKRVEQIKKTPAKDNGAVAPVLLQSLGRL